MADTILRSFLIYLVVGSACTVASLCVYAYRGRRLTRATRLSAIKGLYGAHYQRRSFLMGGKR